jgi:transcriptional regulator with XRE-family HTH domain
MEATAVKLEIVKPKQREGRFGQLSADQQKAVTMLVDGYTGKEVAEALGVTETTVSKWRKRKVFCREYVRLAQQVTENGINILKTNLTEAVQRLIEISESSNPNRVQLEANKHIIKLVMEDEVLKTLNERLEKLEAGANREA